MKTMKKLVSLVLAAACLMSLAVFASAAETVSSSTVTANVYVAGKDNPYLDGVTAYFTPSGWTAAIRPTTPSTNNATKTVDSKGNTVITIPLNNTVFRIISFPDGTDIYTNTSGRWSAEITKRDGKYASELAYTFFDTTNVEAGTTCVIEGCNCYALPAAIVGDNSGEITVPVSMMVGTTPN